MVFLIQRRRTRTRRAVHLKLNELVAAMQGASNRLIDVEDLSEKSSRLYISTFDD
jgi:low affinity Fe/Cu permease